MIADLEEAQRIGAIGPGPLAGHIDHALGFLDVLAPLPTGSALLDLGSGGGIPGLVLASARPDLSVVLLDGRVERASRLQNSVVKLGLSDRVRVLAERAEVAGRSSVRSAFDAVVARGFGSPPVTAECAAPFLRIGGHLVVSEPPDVQIAERWPADPLAMLGLEFGGASALPFHYVVLRSVRPCPDRYPRRTGIPRKRPLF